MTVPLDLAKQLHTAIFQALDNSKENGYEPQTLVDEGGIDFLLCDLLDRDSHIIGLMPAGFEFGDASYEQLVAIVNEWLDKDKDKSLPPGSDAAPTPVEDSAP